MRNTGPTIAEFDLIERLRLLQSSQQGVVVGIGDDCAVLEPTSGLLLVTCTDSLVEGVHFPPSTSAAAIAHKALAVNVSDMAAMGARPRWAQLALTLPTVDTSWVEGFISGWSELARRLHISLVGGDTTRGPLSVTVQLLGEASRDDLVRRSGAAPADLVAVTGALGGAALALEQHQRGVRSSARLQQLLDRPEPQLAAGLALAGVASACIDLSDGLVGDLGHLTRASQVAAIVDIDQVPMDPELKGQSRQRQLELALAGGDDYQLCFTLPPHARSEVGRRLAAADVSWQVIGVIQPGEGISWQGSDGCSIPPAWQHFSNPAS